MSYNAVGQMVERVVNLTGTSKLQDTWSYDSVGRPTQQSISIDKRESSRRQYQWENGDQLKSIIDSISNMGVEYS